MSGGEGLSREQDATKATGLAQAHHRAVANSWHGARKYRSTEWERVLTMPRTLDDALSISPINAALVEGGGDYPDTLVRLLKDGSIKGLQIQGVVLSRVTFTTSSFKEFKTSVNAARFNCRPLDR